MLYFLLLETALSLGGPRGASLGQPLLDTGPLGGSRVTDALLLLLRCSLLLKRQKSTVIPTTGKPEPERSGRYFSVVCIIPKRLHLDVKPYFKN